MFAKVMSAPQEAAAVMASGWALMWETQVGFWAPGFAIVLLKALKVHKSWDF